MLKWSMCGIKVVDAIQLPFSTFMCELKISSVASLFDLTDFIET